MKRSYKLLNLGCANCAAKMEDKINKLDTVNSARISFMTQRFTLDAANDSFEQTLEQAQSIITSYESDCVIVGR